VNGLRNRQAPGLRFEVGMSPEASREMGPLREYLNVLRSRAGEGVVVVFDEDSAFTEECQIVFKEVGIRVSDPKVLLILCFTPVLEPRKA